LILSTHSSGDVKRLINRRENMARRKDVPTRHEVTEKIESNRKEMEGKETDLDKIASDVETVRQTIEQLDFSGTAEGSEQMESSIESAEDVTREVFDREDDSLEEVQTHNEEFEGELQDRQGSSESDLGKISDSSAKIETKETINELVKAKEAVLHDIDFLVEQIRRASDARKESDAIQERLRTRVHTGKRGR
jgi:6-pyruvoyl-tetrahydropterin synthase